jgi:hypothetical protein
VACLGYCLDSILRNPSLFWHLLISSNLESCHCDTGEWWGPCFPRTLTWTLCVSFCGFPGLFSAHQEDEIPTSWSTVLPSLGRLWICCDSVPLGITSRLCFLTSPCGCSVPASSSPQNLPVCKAAHASGKNAGVNLEVAYVLTQICALSLIV